VAVAVVVVVVVVVLVVAVVVVVVVVAVVVVLVAVSAVAVILAVAVSAVIPHITACKQSQLDPQQQLTVNLIPSGGAKSSNCCRGSAVKQTNKQRPTQVTAVA